MKYCAVILAAGRGKRMNSLKPKVLHEVLGRPILQYAFDAVQALNPQKVVVVVSNAADEVKKQIKGKTVSFVVQKKLLGTGNALAETKNALKNVRNATIVVLNGDSPLITTKTLRKLLRKHKENRNHLSFFSFTDDTVSGYGRVLRDETQKVVGIIEDRHATSKHRNLKEFNGGVYAIEPEILNYLSRLKRHRASGEYYLTDLVGIVSKIGKKVEAYNCPSEEVKGINTRAELYQVSEILNRRNILKWMKNGVTFISPASSIVHSSVAIGKDTIIYPNTYLEGNTLIGRNCIVYPGARIYDSVLGDGVMIREYTIIEKSKISNKSTIGPFAHIISTQNSKLKTLASASRLGRQNSKFLTLNSKL